jgi:uncharacterized protein YhbP (UPF0306 family)
MNDSQTEQIIRDYMPRVLHMSLATCADNRPWVSELRFAFDNDLNLYWRSLPTTRHSRELAGNPQVAGTIMIQHDGQQPLRGIYFEGQADRLTDVTEDSPAYQALRERWGIGPEKLEEAHTAGGHQFYRVHVSDYYLFDTYPEHPAGKHHLAWGK